MERAATEQHGDERLLPAAPGATLGREGGDVDKKALESRRESGVAISFHHQRCPSKRKWNCAAAAPLYQPESCSLRTGTAVTSDFIHGSWEGGLRTDITRL